jgi:hypothetical protein
MQKSKIQSLVLLDLYHLLLPATALADEIFKAARVPGRDKLSQSAIVNLWEKLLKIQVGG